MSVLKEIEPGEKRKCEEKDNNNKKMRRLTIMEYIRKPKEKTDIGAAVEEDSSTQKAGDEKRRGGSITCATYPRTDTALLAN